MHKSEIETSPNLSYQCLRSAPLVLMLAVMLACGHPQAPGVGHQQRMRLTVGDIREVSLPRPADTTSVLTGSSDNTEVVDVSAQQFTQTNPAPTTSPRPLVFLIKGVTIGTARVVFSEKRAATPGEGQPRKIYLVQVVSK